MRAVGTVRSEKTKQGHSIVRCSNDDRREMERNDQHAGAEKAKRKFKKVR